MINETANVSTTDESLASAATADSATNKSEQSQQQASTDETNADATTQNEEPSEGNEGGKGAEGEKPTEPVEYTDFNLPEGMSADENLMGGFKELAKEANIPQEQAQKFVDLYSKHAQGMAEQFVEQSNAEFKATNEAWRKETQGFYGTKEKFDEATAHVGRALERFGNKELRQYLTDTGLGNSVHFYEFCKKVGESVSEASIPENGGRASSKSAEEVLYDHK